MRRRILAAILLISLAGCTGLGVVMDDDPTEEPWNYRVVVENGYYSTAEFTVSLETDAGGRVLNETRSLTPDERWVVTTLSESELESGEYSVTVSTAEYSRDVTDEGTVADAGATLLVVGGATGGIVTCGGNVTCYEEIDR
jgi:hypothetical protein